MLITFTKKYIYKKSLCRREEDHNDPIYKRYFRKILVQEDDNDPIYKKLYLQKILVQEEDHDDPLRVDQRTLGNLDGAQVHRNHVKIRGEGRSKQNLISKQIHCERM